MWARVLLDNLVASQRLIAHCQARFAADLAELSGSYPGLREHLATEIAVNLGMSEGSANRQLDEATELAARLPGTVSAQWQGELTGWKVTAVRSETADIGPGWRRLHPAPPTRRRSHLDHPIGHPNPHPSTQTLAPTQQHQPARRVTINPPGPPGRATVA